jgi:hypothetical protein
MRAATARERAAAHLRTGTGACAGLYEPDAQDASDPNKRCTHGPDVWVPDGSYATTAAATSTSGSTTPLTASNIPCYTSGPYVHVFYVYSGTNYLDASGASARRPMIRELIGLSDKMFQLAASSSSAVRHVRWRMSSSCKLLITPFKSSTTNIYTLHNALLNAGKLSRSEKGLAFMENWSYCQGLGELRVDDRHSTTSNANNQGNMLAMVAHDCFRNGYSVPSGAGVTAHELLHTLGAVQNSAPHSTKAGHCFDESDVMCYSDSSGKTMQKICGVYVPERLDCGRNDYFRVNPPSGSYLATHWNTSDSKFLSRSVSAHVDVLARPKVSVSADPDGMLEGTATVTAVATPPSGASIRRVDFYRNGVLFKQDTSSPFNVTFNTQLPNGDGVPTGGTVSFTAQAIDTFYRVSPKSSRTFSVENPMVHLTAPTGPASGSGTMTWTADAVATSKTTVSKVEFFVNGVLTGPADTSAPYEGQFTLPGSGIVSVQAKVTDSAGVTRLSQTVPVTVIPPTVTLVSPGYYETLTGSTLLAANASSRPGTTIDSVAFRVDGALIGTDTTEPYSVVWASPSAGDVTAMATDSTGGTSTSYSVTISVEAADGLTVVSTPASGSSVSGQVTSAATGPNTSIDWYIDGLYLDSSVEGEAFSWDSTDWPNGIHVLTALMYGDNGSARSVGTLINVDNPSPTITASASASLVGAAATLSATVSGGTPYSDVSFLVNGDEIDSDYSAPYSVAYNTTYYPDGPVYLQARATFDTGSPNYISYEVTSEPVLVDIANLRTSIGAPASNATVAGTTSLTASAYADYGATIEWVRFFIDGSETAVARDSTAPYSYAWNSTSVADGAHTVQSRVYTSDGRSVASATRSFTVNN